jgi:hypothetical protein
MSSKVHDLEDKIKHVQAEGAAGESAATPLIVGVEVWVWLTAAVLVIVALSLLAYRLAA